MKEDQTQVRQILRKNPIQRNTSMEDPQVLQAIYDTIGNAFYARVSHTDWNGWRRLLIITNQFHMNRTKAIFDWIFGIPPPQQGNINNKDQPYQLYYLASADVGLSTEALQARQEREQASLANVRGYAAMYTTLPAVYQMLTTQHGLYTASKLIQRASSAAKSETTDLVKRSYGAAASNNPRRRRLQTRQATGKRSNPIAVWWRRLVRS